jgi:UDP-3-O-[3-hydroxymyristoyl] glucosamine N-acyltransferase
LKFTAQQIAGILEGTIVGDPDIKVSKLAKIEEGKKGTLTFLANPKYKSYIYTTEASVTIVNADFVPEYELKTTLIKVEDAYGAFTKLLEYYNQIKLNKSGIEQPSYISDSAKLGNDIYVGAFTYIGDNVTIGDNVKIFPNSYISDNVSIGNNSIVFAGVKIYSDCVVGNNCCYKFWCYHWC